jgi:two-component system, sensor histidine kinase and response regulator
MAYQLPPTDPSLVDVSVLVRLVGDDAELIAEFLQEFEKSLVAHGDVLRAPIGTTLEPVFRAAHTLKSTARAAGALSLGDALQALEAAARAEDRATVQQLLPSTLALLDRVHENLAAALRAA